MITIGICGASGSGKSTMAREIRDSLTCNALILGQDCYYKDYSHLPFQERCRINYDEPDVFDFDELLEDLNALERGGPSPAMPTTIPTRCGRIPMSCSCPRMC